MRGLCPECGKKLNETCDGERDTIDPRLAVFAFAVDDEEPLSKFEDSHPGRS